MIKIVRIVTLLTLWCIGALFLFAGVITGQPKTVKEVNGLIGPVHTVTSVIVELAKVDGVWVESKRYPPSLMTFDETGNIGGFGTSDQSQMSGGGGTQTYNEKGQLIEQRVTRPDGVVVSKVLFAYDEAGNQTELSNFYYGKLQRKIVSTFDDKRNRTSLGEYDSDNKLYRKLTWTFDEKGNRTEWTESHSQGDEMVLFEKLVDTFDDKGNLLTEIQYGNPEGSVDRK